MKIITTKIRRGKVILLVSVLLSGFLVKSSQNQSFESYKQEIPNTNLFFEMVPIPAGEFLMGTSADEYGHEEDESPQRKVSIDAFWMGAHEVTWDIFELFLDKDYEKAISTNAITQQVDGLSRPSTPYLDMTFGMGKENKPALAMTQYGAIQFCKWLYLKTGVFYRLPTEAEWEYAARAGSKSTYFFGEDVKRLSEYAVFDLNSKGETMPVGSKKPNPWGLFDMLGNVMEWTYDHYAPYRVSVGVLYNPVEKSKELYPQVLRGGHYESDARELRSGKRFASDPIWKQLDPQIPKSQWWFPEAPFVGMRVVRPLTPPSEEEIHAYYNQEPIADY
ncbi:MAG: formylglycine-generating enzyme family protein [Cyclobacteriaceae bacterium]|nr:formylglycine-generating enzyme family protein [Cyclobacteriaceae bacterium]